MSTDLNIALIVASVRPQRTADLLLPWLRTRLRAAPGLDLIEIDLREADLDGAHMQPGGCATSIADGLERADGFLILVPEYNHSFPGALKDAIDLHFSQWAHKPVSFVGYGAASGGMRAIEQLRLIFPELRATTTRDVVTVSAPWAREDGFRPTPGEDGALEATLADLMWWATALRAARVRDEVAV